MRIWTVSFVPQISNTVIAMYELRLVTFRNFLYQGIAGYKLPLTQKNDRLLDLSFICGRLHVHSLRPQFHPLTELAQSRWSQMMTYP